MDASHSIQPSTEKVTAIAHLEDVHDAAGLARYEQQEEEGYNLGWKSFIAITALALGNSCAALTNTASLISMQTSIANADQAAQSNTTIRFQIAAVGSPNLASWIGNASFLLTLCVAPIFVRSFNLMEDYILIEYF